MLSHLARRQEAIRHSFDLMPMPERLDRVTIALPRGDVVIPWDSRDQLIDRMKHLEDAKSAIRAFKGAGASSPVKLDPEGKAVILDVINHWANELKDGYRDLPEGIWDLRNALSGE